MPSSAMEVFTPCYINRACEMKLSTLVTCSDYVDLYKIKAVYFDCGKHCTALAIIENHSTKLCQAVCNSVPRIAYQEVQ